jgi:hypothetical protein
MAAEGGSAMFNGSALDLLGDLGDDIPATGSHCVGGPSNFHDQSPYPAI